ncbi:MAG: hypothetical protein H0V47_09975 [Chloroflexia bacterium]|nr:hypothetical protein [Chloroflexia bacterium]
MPEDRKFGQRIPAVKAEKTENFEARDLTRFLLIFVQRQEDGTTIVDGISFLERYSHR